jgi:hypothetical protein
MSTTSCVPSDAGAGGSPGSGGSGAGGAPGTGGGIAGSDGGTGTGGTGAGGVTGTGGAGTGGVKGTGGAGTGGACTLDGAAVVNPTLVNGGFDAPVLIAPTSYAEVAVGFEPGSFGWLVTTNSVTLTRDTWLAAPPSEGHQYLDLVGTGSTGGVRQSFQTIAGQTYRVMFAYANNPYADANPAASVVVTGCTGPLISETIRHDGSTGSN